MHSFGNDRGCSMEITGSKLNSKELRSSDVLFSDGSIGASLLREIIEASCKNKASDIHVEKLNTGLRVRLRIHGQLKDLNQLAPQIDLGNDRNSRNLIIQIKKIAKMNLSVSDEVQDGSFGINSIRARFRVALSPTLHGESIVMRCIYETDLPHLDEINLPDSLNKKIREIITKSQGIIIISGPTGSGKSTTMQAMINSIDRTSRKVISVENPIEREMPGVVQKEITWKVNWASAIKMALREDPDVIYIGEIRDPESAMMAIEASMTGHLVLTTVHANSSLEILERLKSLGVSTYEIEKNIKLLLAQRLVFSEKRGERIPCFEYRTNKGDQFEMESSIQAEVLSLFNDGVINETEVKKWLI
ncbi:MAG: hypothetical protein COV57_03045 [Candidatus Liptonbacteria bacterium CG11_big_fil_rev_8_21_14_0_20_35_14]|uniref:AAA+ ATPase domain-containing protein n=1 Tax=Candidatus Liptonbacteria bacterium CG11_big_fil_rev_8_21_14_0_20_35_14 TaxID=1974634 RepID=A0A2H0N6Z2_9BACT|nr:MAG: hypothetical protein COV57_03045 [Candidatus Liptonbacteria bacterium CG11_big_fil_rev_8_21_14_0_20_35_14]